MYLIPEQRWVTANFKETQIAHMKIGQKAWFSVDALNHQQFTGKVSRISPATGSEFSVLKPDNTTGNFTKVVQRIAVRIEIDPKSNRLFPFTSQVCRLSPLSTPHLKALI